MDKTKSTHFYTCLLNLKHSGIDEKGNIPVDSKLLDLVPLPTIITRLLGLVMLSVVLSVLRKLKKNMKVDSKVN